MNETAVAGVDRWLADKKITLWSTFDVSDPVQRRAASEWFWTEIRDLMSSPTLSSPADNTAPASVGQERKS